MNIIGGNIIGPILGGGISTNTSTIEQVVPATIVLDFTTAYGTSFLLTHDLNMEDFICQLYKTDISPKEIVLPINISPSGPNQILVELDVPMNGRVILIKI